VVHALYLFMLRYRKSEEMRFNYFMKP